MKKIREKKAREILNKPDYASYNALKDWFTCPNLYKLTRIDKIYLFDGNIFTAFGHASHKAIEDELLNIEEIKKNKGNFILEDIFEERFRAELEDLPEHILKELDQEKTTEFVNQGREILPEVIPSLEKYFPGYKVLSCEEELKEKIIEYPLEDYSFKGYIDLVLSTPDGKIHILDWKATSWGWKLDKKNDKLTTYQLTMYKIMYARKHNIPLSNIETHFGLLKRTAKKGSHVEIFRVSSGPKKINNVTELIYDALYNIDHDNFIKNKSNCRGCDFYRTKYCPHTVDASKEVVRARPKKRK